MFIGSIRPNQFALSIMSHFLVKSSNKQRSNPPRQYISERGGTVCLWGRVVDLKENGGHVCIKS